MNVPRIKTHVVAEVDLCNTITMLNDKDRIEWMAALLETIDEEGTIEAMRILVNDSRFDDEKFKPAHQ